MDLTHLRGAIRGRAQGTRLGAMFLNSFTWNTRFVDGTYRRVPYRVHQMFKLWLREYPDLAEESKLVYNAYTGGDFIDVGAFQGWYSLLLSPKAAPGNSFVSVEPDSRALPELFHGVATLKRLFPQLSLSVVDRPAGDGSLAQITFPSEPNGHPSFQASAEASTGIPTLTMDQLAKAMALKPRFIKIDVEGAEYHVLRGMEATLSNYRPTLMLETHPQWLPSGTSLEDVYQFVARLGYSRSDINACHTLCYPGSNR